MINLYVKENCAYCNVLEDILIANDVEFDKYVIKNGACPKLAVDNDIIFTGLPDYEELMEFIDEWK